MTTTLTEIGLREKTPFTDVQLAVIERHYSPVQARYITLNLGKNDIVPIDETKGMGVGDYLAIAIMEDAMQNKMKLFAKLKILVPQDMKHYAREQINWLEYEGRMCELKEKRRIDMRDRIEYQHVLHVFNDEHHNNERFNLFYRIKNRKKCKYPEKGPA